MVCASEQAHNKPIKSSNGEFQMPVFYWKTWKNCGESLTRYLDVLEAFSVSGYIGHSAELRPCKIRQKTSKKCKTALQPGALVAMQKQVDVWSTSQALFAPVVLAEICGQGMSLNFLTSPLHNRSEVKTCLQSHSKHSNYV